MKFTNRAALTAAAALILTATTASAAGPDLIAVRQAGFSLTAGAFGQIRTVVAAKGDVKPLENVAKGLAKYGAVIPTLFPKGTETGGSTKALAEIWTDTPGFEKAAAAFSASATKLAELAKAGDLDGVTAEMKVLGDSCGGCHKTYRAK